MITYNNYSREQLLGLLHLKNKKIDSQRSMLFQSRVRRDKLQAMVADSPIIIKENIKLILEINRLKKRIERIMPLVRNKAWSIKEHGPVIMNTIMAYFKLKRECIVTNNEMVFLIVAYKHQGGYFTLSVIEAFNKTWGRNPDYSWRNEFLVYAEARYFHLQKQGRKCYYFISLQGLQWIKGILKYLYTGNK